MIKVRLCGISFAILPLLAALALAAFGGRQARSQGIIPFSTQAPGQLTSIDMANSNILFSFPIRNKVGAIPFQYALIGNFPPNPASPYGYETIGISGTMIGTGSPVSANAGQGQNHSCGKTGQGNYYTTLSYWYVLDSVGTYHPVPYGNSIYVSQYTGTGCKNSGSFTAMTQDGSGYTLTVTGRSERKRRLDGNGDRRPRKHRPCQRRAVRE